MKTEAELRELHQRLVKVLTWASGTGVPRRLLNELVLTKVQLEWILGKDTKSAESWSAVLFRGLNNLEGLKLAGERSREAAQN